MLRYTHYKHIESGYMCTTDGSKISSVLTGHVRLGGKVVIKPVGPGFNGSEPTTRWKTIK